MRWRWWRPEPELGGHHAWPDHGRDEYGRQVDGDRVSPDGSRGWADLLPTQPTDPLTEPTQVVPTVEAPLMTPAQQWRSRGGRR